MKIQLSICIPTFNREPYLRQLLGSLKSQQRPDVEIIVSDNASSDGTSAAIREIQPEFENLKYVRSETNVGPDGNFLACINASNGEHCWFIGSDDDIVPGAIDVIMEFIDKNNPDGIVVNKANYDRELRLPKKTYNPMGEAVSSKIVFGTDEYYRLIASLGYIGAICIRRETWLSVEPQFIGSAYVHVYICQEMIRRGAKFSYLADPLIKWRYENDSILKESKLLGRLQIEFNYLDITKFVFGPSSKEYIWVRDDLAKANIFWQLVTAKISGGYSSQMKELSKKYLADSYVYPSRILPLCWTPASLLRGLRTIRRSISARSK